MSFMRALKQAQADALSADPWRRMLELAVRGIESIGSAALLEALGVPATTGNARRLADNMRALGFIPLKSRRLLPGGFHGTTVRGWTRSIRDTRHGEKVTARSRPPVTPLRTDAQRAAHHNFAGGQHVR